MKTMCKWDSDAGAALDERQEPEVSVPGPDRAETGRLEVVEVVLGVGGPGVVAHVVR